MACVIMQSVIRDEENLTFCKFKNDITHNLCAKTRVSAYIMLVFRAECLTLRCISGNKFQKYH